MIENVLHVYPQNLGSNAGEYPHYVTFTAIARGDVRKGTVALYLPADALKSSYSQTYGDADLGAIGVAIGAAPSGAAEKIATKLENLGMSVGGGNAKGALTAIAGLATGTGELAGGLNLSNAIAQATVNEAIRGASGKAGTAVTALQRKAGRILNPHKAVIYSGPGGFRTFSFNYTMTPENEKEAKSIADIVYFFKYHMHPDTPSGEWATTKREGPPSQSGAEVTTTHKIKGGINTSLSFTYPEEFQIKMHVNREHKESPSNPLFRIKNCFLDTLNVDYTTSGAPAFITKGTKSVPATTTMAMTFKETVLMTKNSVAEGY